MRISEQAMREFLSLSISSMNKNKLNGLLAEVEFRRYLADIGYADQVSVGGWIARCTGPERFGHDTVVMFPETVRPDIDYPSTRPIPTPTMGLHTICATFHQIGIKSYFCTPVVPQENDPRMLQWNSRELGIPFEAPIMRFPDAVTGFIPRTRTFNFLRYHTDVSGIPKSALHDEFTKEALRVSFQNRNMSEISDIDGILWGKSRTYPMEIKEKTPAFDKNLGEYFGLDVGPFVKLAFYAAKRGNLHSLFVVREINNIESRELVDWWFITFETLAQYASWVGQGGGKNMQGGGSTVVKIPKAEFRRLDKESLGLL